MFANIFKTICIVLFASVWLALCIAKYNKWNKKRKNCTKELSVKVVDVLELASKAAGSAATVLIRGEKNSP